MTEATPDIGPLRPAEIASASRLLATALLADPGWVHVVPNVQQRELALRAVTSMALRDSMPFGNVLAARVGGRLAGVAVWQPPGSYPMTVRRKARTVPAMTVLAARAPRSIRDLSRFGASLDAVFPTVPVWYLQALGVHPDLQRRGHGHRLVAPILTAAERSCVGCYLETAEPANIAYYQRLGFSLVAPVGPLYPGGPAMARMATRVSTT